MPSNAPLDLFVYGTLKRGQRAHERFCSTAEPLGEAWVIGMLRIHVDGYPVLVLPPMSVLARGTASPAADAAGERAQFALSGNAASPAPNSACRDGWRRILGEVLRFHAPALELPPIDAFEDVSHDTHSLYARVLVRVEAAAVRFAWTYAAASPHRVAGLPAHAGDSWP
jgi:gamma-glutamylcyclotransferase (GGCT)/AIG2-like uncharacterized protein YtfP